MSGVCVLEIPLVEGNYVSTIASANYASRLRSVPAENLIWVPRQQVDGIIGSDLLAGESAGIRFVRSTEL